MEINRRYFLASVSGIALAFASNHNAESWMRGSQYAPFNGGQSQINFQTLQVGNDFAFMNYIKNSQDWKNGISGVAPAANTLDLNGYPTSISGGGPGSVFTIPSQTSRPGDHIIRWQGTGTLQLSTFSVVTVSGNLTGTNGSYRFTPAAFAISGAVTASDILSIIFNGASLLGSPITVNYTVVGGDTTTTITTALATAINANTTLTKNGITATGVQTQLVIQGLDIFGAPVTVTSSVSNGATETISPVTSVAIQITATNSTGNLQNLTWCHIDDDYALNVEGQVFSQKFLSILQQAGWGAYRFLNWMFPAGDQSCAVSQWQYRKPINHLTYFGGDYRASAFGTPTTKTLGAYATTLTGFSLVHGATVLVQWPTSAASANVTAIDLSGTFIVVTLDAMPFSNGQQVQFNSVGGTQISQDIFVSVASLQPFSPTITNVNGNIITLNALVTPSFTASIAANIMTVTGTAAGTVAIGNNVSLSGGGAAGQVNYQISGTPGGNGTYYVDTAQTIGSQTLTQVYSAFTSGGTCTERCTLNVNGTGDIELRQANGAPTSAYPVATRTATLVYDIDFNSWCTFGGSNNDSGINSGVPIEIMVQLCNKMGAHPWFVMPYMALDPMTDYVPQLAAYLKNNLGPGLIPRIEGPNEQWNGQFAAENYSQYKGILHWQLNTGGSSSDNWYGKILSTIGQAVKNVYGSVNGNICQVIGGVQTANVDFSAGGSNSRRFKSIAYVAQSQAAQTGYIISAAYNYATHYCIANYINPADESTPVEITLAYQYANGTASAIDTYANSVNVSTYTSLWASHATFASGLPVPLTLTCYEGGYSPDLSSAVAQGTSTGGSASGGNNAFAPITGASKANPCILTLGSQTTPSSQAYSAVVGQQLTIASVVGMTQLNGNTYTVTNVAANLISINVDSTGFTAYSSGGTATYVNSATQIANLRLESELLSQIVGTLVTSTYATLLAAPGVFPSHFDLSGPATGIWHIFDPTIYGTISPQFAAIAKFNGH